MDGREDAGGDGSRAAREDGSLTHTHSQVDGCGCEGEKGRGDRESKRERGEFRGREDDGRWDPGVAVASRRERQQATTPRNVVVVVVMR